MMRLHCNVYPIKNSEGGCCAYYIAFIVSQIKSSYGDPDNFRNG